MIGSSPDQGRIQQVEEMFPHGILFTESAVTIKNGPFIAAHANLFDLQDCHVSLPHLIGAGPSLIQ
jgi:hypothetical protein